MIDLAQVRRERQITQEELASSVGLRRQTISNIENGYMTPSVPTAQAIAKILGIRWTEFYE